MTTDSARTTSTWKGLDTSRMPVFLGYDQIERMIAALLDRAAAWGPDEVVGIVRGGLVPAAMASGILALPLSFLRHDAASGGVDWVGPPASGRRVLLVDDCCSSGVTLQRARAMLEGEGRDCLTMVVVHDPDTVKYIPDLSHPMRDLFRLPWERGEATPTGRAAKAAGTHLDPSAEAPFFGMVLDESLLTAIAAHGDAAADLPGFPVRRSVFFATVPDTERHALITTLAGTRYRAVPLEWVPSDTDLSVARAATRFGCTHVVTGGAAGAIAIAGFAPHLIVSWWSWDAGRAWIIGAASAE